jgi:molecular chaperone GrpE
MKAAIIGAFFQRGEVMDERLASEDGAQGSQLREQLDSALQQAAENRDKYLRALADMENARKRLERLCEERMWQQKKRLLMYFLEVGDQLEDALQYDKSDDPVSAGIRITYEHLQKILNQEGVEVLTSVGTTFDPRVHEAVELAEGGQTGSNEVTFEYRKGYLADGKLLRPARVQVTREA